MDVEEGRGVMREGCVLGLITVGDMEVEKVVVRGGCELGLVRKGDTVVMEERDVEG